MREALYNIGEFLLDRHLEKILCVCIGAVIALVAIELCAKRYVVGNAVGTLTSRQQTLGLDESVMQIVHRCITHSSSIDDIYTRQPNTIIPSREWRESKSQQLVAYCLKDFALSSPDRETFDTRIAIIDEMGFAVPSFGALL